MNAVTATGRRLVSRTLGLLSSGLIVCAIGFAALPGSAARAQTLAEPLEKVILTVSGTISQTNAGARAVFDRPMLLTLPGAVVETETPWTEGKKRFEGVLVRDVLADHKPTLML